MTAEQTKLLDEITAGLRASLHPLQAPRSPEELERLRTAVVAEMGRLCALHGPGVKITLNSVVYPDQVNFTVEGPVAVLASIQEAMGRVYVESSARTD